MSKTKPLFAILILITVLLSLFVFLDVKVPVGRYNVGMPPMRFGIDINGGVDAAFVPKDLDRAPTREELESAKSIIETRLDQKNILDREVIVDTVSGSVTVRFPWSSTETTFDPQKAIMELGETARLTFRDPEGNILVEGKNVRSSKPEMSTQYGGYVVALEFDDEGRRLFADATELLLGKRIGIYMDETLITDPEVQSHITEGNAVITGQRNMQDAKDLSDKIAAGALPFSLESSNHSIISPTLGKEALSVMINAGIAAFIIMALILIGYYRLPGLVATFMLALQLVGQMLALALPQITLTLPGIAGILLTIGMGCDANIIIAERISEEIKGGRDLDSAILVGFKRAFSSVFDGNITLLLVGIVMMIYGSGAMLSFAYTLCAGVVLNFACGVALSRVMILSVSRFNIVRELWMYTCPTRRIEA